MLVQYCICSFDIVPIIFPRVNTSLLTPKHALMHLSRVGVPERTSSILRSDHGHIEVLRVLIVLLGALCRTCRWNLSPVGTWESLLPGFSFFLLPYLLFPRISILSLSLPLESESIRCITESNLGEGQKVLAFFKFGDLLLLLIGFNITLMLY